MNNYGVLSNEGGDILRDVSMAKKATRLLAVSFVLCFILFLSASNMSVRAKTTTTTVNFYFTNNPDPVPLPNTKFWISEEGVLLSRNYPHSGDVWGDLTGSLVYVGDLNSNDWYFTPDWHLVILGGVGGGSLTLDVDGGTFEGIMRFKIIDGVVYGKFTLHGSGSFDGMLLKGTFEGPLGSPATATGVIKG